MTKVERNELNRGGHLSRDDRGALSCNAAPLRFWTHTGYREEDVRRLCSEISHEWMFAMVSFHGAGKISFSVSQRTWERNEGHYPVVMQLFDAVAKDPRLSGARGSLVVWLEDGMWDWCQPYGRRAPILSFGRNVQDTTTLLLPDPAFVGAFGYAAERHQSEQFAARVSWDQRRPTIFWRGAATGIGIEGPEWVHTSRAKLVREAKEIGDSTIVDAKLTRIRHLPPQAKEILLSEGLVDEEVPFESFFNFKYVVDVDGYHCAWKSLFLKLMMGSVVLKVDSPFEQWYHDRLVPWRHYVPVSKDIKELKQVHEWLLHHDQAAREIALAGSDFIASVNLERSLDQVVGTVQGVLATQKD